VDGLVMKVKNSYEKNAYEDNGARSVHLTCKMILLKMSSDRK
jgi:hypothetical protein